MQSGLQAYRAPADRCIIIISVSFHMVMIAVICLIVRVIAVTIWKHILSNEMLSTCKMSACSNEGNSKEARLTFGPIDKQTYGSRIWRNCDHCMILMATQQADYVQLSHPLQATTPVLGCCCCTHSPHTCAYRTVVISFTAGSLAAACRRWTD